MATVQSETGTLQAELRSLKSQLSAFDSTPTLAELQGTIVSLSIDRDTMSARLTALKTGNAKKVDTKENLAVETELKKLGNVFSSRKRIVRDLWAIVRDGLPEGKQERELKEELGLI